MDWKGLLRNPWKLVAFTVAILFIITLIALLFHSTTSSCTNYSKTNLARSEEPKLQLWPNAVVPYTIDPVVDSRAQQLIRKAIKGIEDKTCIRFIDTFSKAGRNWINFVRDDHECPFPETVGMSNKTSGAQDILISADCLSSGQIQRHLGLTLGLGFEETRPDRDNFVRYTPELPGCIAGINNEPVISKLHHPSAATKRLYFAMRLGSNQSTDSLRLGSSDAEYGGTFSVLDIEKLNAIYNCSGCHSYRFRPISEVTEKVKPFESFNPVLAGIDYLGEHLYICRAYHHGSLMTGKLTVENGHGSFCWTTSANATDPDAYIFFQNFEVLTNPQSVKLNWLKIDGGSKPQNKAIVDGMTYSRRQFYIGRCSLELFTWNGKEARPVIPGFIFPGGTNASVVNPYGEQRYCSPVEVLNCEE